jgi:hypothetical protein
MSRQSDESDTSDASDQSDDLTQKQKRRPLPVALREPEGIRCPC